MENLNMVSLDWCYQSFGYSLSVSQTGLLSSPLLFLEPTMHILVSEHLSSPLPLPTVLSPRYLHSHSLRVLPRHPRSEAFPDGSVWNSAPSSIPIHSYHSPYLTFPHSTFYYMAYFKCLFVVISQKTKMWVLWEQGLCLFFVFFIFIAFIFFSEDAWTMVGAQENWG